jgi:hypothetical protein
MFHVRFEMIGAQQEEIQCLRITSGPACAIWRGNFRATRQKSEQLMEQLTADLRDLPESARHDLRGDLMMVVGELARLSTRISEMDTAHCIANRKLCLRDSGSA